MTEKEFQKKLFKKLGDILTDQDKRNDFHIGTEVPVPYSQIYIPRKGITNLEIFFFKQDIAIYKELFQAPGKSENHLVNTKPPVDITLEGLGKSTAGLPFVIMELKCGHPITHEILTYTQKAAMIKTIFPYCQYLFVIAADKVALRTWRHGNFFDEIIHMDDPLRDSQIKELKTTIQKHLKKAKKTCKRMDTDNVPS